MSTLRERRQLATRRMWIGILARTLTTALLTAAVLILGVRLYLARDWSPESRGNRLPPAPSAYQGVQTAQHLLRIEAAIEVYRIEKGQYPETLQQVVDAGLLGARALRFPNFEFTYHYRRTDSSFELAPPLY